MTGGGALTVGIDLGTTHTVVAWAGADEGAPRVLSLSQWVSRGETEALPLLPSCLYAPAESELASDPFGDAPWVIGEWARRRGQEVPGRLVASAKSWLGYGAVDRTAAILPWGLEPDDPAPRVSPVEASARVLRHVAAAWDRAFPERRLAAQRIVLTVPASFDEVARELTVRAAEEAGLSVRLLEEPQAAFYDYMARAGGAGLEALLGDGRDEALVLVCDVGGGTTDLTLIRVRRGAEQPLELERVAVGRHLLLGGDNVDLALAYRLEASLVPPPERLAPSRFNQLVLACRAAKERLLAADAPEEMPVVVAGAGSSLVGSTLSARLARADVERVVLDGFLPEVARDARPSRGRAGLVAFGLPYESDAAITRHVAHFFARHSDRPGPDAVLLNGGLFRAARAAERLRDVVASWGGPPPLVLPQPEPDLAVARGAVVYGRTLDGAGLRIGGGAPHGFYVGVDAGVGRSALSVVPRGAREGERHVATSPGLSLRVGRPVRFELYAGDGRERHAPGEVVRVDDEHFHALPQVSAAFEAASPSDRADVPIALEGELSAVGTIELACVELDPPSGAAPRRFRLAFDLRAAAAPSEPAAAKVASARPASGSGKRLEPAFEAVDRVFGKSRSDLKGREAKDLVRDLERLLGERKTWTLEQNRALADAVIAGHGARRRSEDHERVFWMLAGYGLRPGFGEARDAERARILAPLFEPGLGFAKEARGWQQFFIAWRRIAAGLGEPIQARIRDTLDPFLAPSEAKLKRPKQWKPLADDEMLELASWLERVPVERRIALGKWLLERTWTKKDPRLWAAIGRLGARVPLYASAHHVVPPREAERWLDHLLRERWEAMPAAAAAAAQLARVTDDRARDVSDALRAEVARRLEAAAAPSAAVDCVRTFVPVAAAERADRFGEELPVGLRLTLPPPGADPAG